MRHTGAVFVCVLILVTGMLVPGIQTALADVSFGDEVIVPADVTVKDAVSMGDDVIVYGRVRTDAVAIGGNVTIEPGGEVGGHAVAIGGDLELKNGTSVGGDAVVIFGRLIKDYDVDIGGETVSLFGEFHDNMPSGRHHGDIAEKMMKIFVFGPIAGMFGVIGFIIGTILLLLKLFFMVVIAALITHFFPEQVVRMAECGRRSFGKSLLLGFLVVVLIPLLVLSFFITLIGIPLIPALLVFLFLVNLYGTVGVSLWAGRLLPNEANRTLMANVILGVLVIWLVKLIPLVGIVVKIGTGLFAFGVVAMAHFAEKRGI